jgi:hypothetical protein
LPEPLSLEEGSYILTVVEEPSEPIETRFGQRLAYRVKLSGSEGVKTLFVPFRETATEDSLLGQLKLLTDKYGSLKNRQLSVHIVGSGRSKRYLVKSVEQEKLESVQVKSREPVAECPTCHSTVAGSFNYCPNCGSKLRG